LIPAILGSIVLVYGGSVFVQRAWRELSGRQPGMMTLISLAIAVAFIASFASALGVFEVDVWWELATLICVMLLGHWLEMKAIAQAQSALGALAALLPDSAERVTESGIDKVPLTELRAGDVVLVRPGSRVTADGIVVERNTYWWSSCSFGDRHCLWYRRRRTAGTCLSSRRRLRAPDRESHRKRRRWSSRQASAIGKLRGTAGTRSTRDCERT
jgi:E1-E2 ATPase